MVVTTSSALPDSKEIEEKLQERMEEQVETPSSQGEIGTVVDKSPVIEEQRQDQEDEREEGSPQQVLRRSSRQRKPNPKYANVALVAKLESLK